MLKKIQYQAGQLRDVLDDFRSQKTSGFVHMHTIFQSEKKPRSRILFLRNGEIVYGGTKILSNQEFARKLGIKFNYQWVDTAVKYAALKLKNPSSFRELLENIIRIRVFKWEEIETSAHTITVRALEETLPYSGHLLLDSTKEIDLCYGTDGHSLDWYKLLQDIADRKREWAALSPFVPSMEAIPQLSSSHRRVVVDSDVQQHLQTWVNGDRSLIEIAEQLEQDPLELARRYMTWVTSGWVTFKKEAPLTQAMKVEEQRPIVLSVDDSAVVQVLIKRALNENYQMLFASNAVDALRMMNSNSIALLLLDVTMPEIDGLEFCRTVRSIPKFKELPIIMVTARDKFSDKLRGQIAGSTHYLTKPFEPKSLLEIVEKYVGVRKQNFTSRHYEYSFPTSGISKNAAIG